MGSGGGRPSTDWLEHGAPAGLREEPNLEGIFPEVEGDDDLLDYNSLSTDYEVFHNYIGVDENPAAEEALQGYISKGFLVPFDTLEERTRFLGEEPILSKLGCITKERLNAEGVKVTKHRIILDARRSFVTSATRGGFDQFYRESRTQCRTHLCLRPSLK